MDITEQGKHQDERKEEGHRLLNIASGHHSLFKYVDWLQSNLLPEFMSADAEAIENQIHQERTLRFTYCISVAAVAVAVCQGILFPTAYYLCWGEVILIIVLLGIVRNAAHRRFLDKWMENRALAEELRCLMFSLPFQGKAQSRGFLDRRSPAGRSRQKWLDAAPTVDLEADLTGLKKFLLNGLIDDQIDYHERNSKKKEKVLKAYEIAGTSLLVTTLLGAVLHAFGLGHHTEIITQIGNHSETVAHGTGVTYGHILVVLAVIFPASASALAAIKHGLALQKVVLRSSAIAQDLCTLRFGIENADNAAELSLVIQELEQYIAHENREWRAIVEHNEAEAA